MLILCNKLFNKIEHRKLWLQDIVVIKVVGVDVEIFMCSGFDLWHVTRKLDCLYVAFLVFIWPVDDLPV